MITESSRLATASVFPASAFDWVLRVLLGFLAVVIGRACWRRRVGREERQKQQEATKLADRTRELAAQKERAEGGNRIKAQFLARISQDIRIPMNDVLNTLELALMTSLTDEQRDLLEHSKSSAREVLTRLCGVLDISSATAEKLVVNRVEFSVRDWVRGVVTTMAAHARENGVELQTHFASDFPTQLVGDPDLLRKVLHTLIKDAIKVSSPGQVILEMRLDRRATTENQSGSRTVPIFFSVESRVMNKERALQTDLRANHSDAGTFFPFCDRLLGLMSGRIWVQPHEGRNKICCTIRLEVRRPTGDETSAAAPAADQEISMKGLRALLVESNRVNQLAVLPVLEKQGLHCLVANDGNEAIALLERFTLDLIIVATQTATPDELEASRLIRERERQTGSHMPILALTAHTTRADREACLQAGADACICQLAPPAQLREAIETVLPINHPTSKLAR